MRPGLSPGSFNFDMCHGRPANPFDLCLLQDTGIWSTIQLMGGVRRVCLKSEDVKYSPNEPPWILMPAQGRRFQVTNTIALPIINTNTTVLQMLVPVGWDGVINGIVNRIVGAGFIEGSGDVLWRIQSSRVYLRDYGQVTTSLGDLTNPCTLYGGGQRIYSGQIITYLVNLTAAGAAHIDPNSLVLCSLSGWTYPRS